MGRRLPIGIQGFEIIRSEDYLYVDKYEAICGITEEELHTCFTSAVGAANKWTEEETYERLKQRYNGYHFSNNMTEVSQQHVSR